MLNSKDKLLAWGKVMKEHFPEMTDLEAGFHVALSMFNTVLAEKAAVARDPGPYLAMIAMVLDASDVSHDIFERHTHGPEVLN